MEEEPAANQSHETATEVAVVPQAKAGHPQLAQINEFLTKYWNVAKSVLVEPKAFFDRILETEPGTDVKNKDWKTPTIFLATSAAIYTTIQCLALVNLLAWLPLFVMSMVYVAVGTLVSHKIYKAMGGKGDMHDTYSVLAYSKATLLFSWINVGALYIGGGIALIYTAYLNLVGLERAHGIPKMKMLPVVAILSLIAFIARFFIR